MLLMSQLGISLKSYVTSLTKHFMILKKNLKNVLLYIGIPLILLGAIAFVNFSGRTSEQKKYSEIVNMIADNKISDGCVNTIERFIRRH